ncbi:hypothetical protein GCM10023156_49410 [Novipirellula rosea]|uniref:Uncharacterized protein n=1 Tax=Novipirellula rosea TaxID=1031540 RepID=A0ABP8ND24_9BACT
MMIRSVTSQVQVHKERNRKRLGTHPVSREPWAVRHRGVRGTRPLTRRGSLNQQAVDDFRYAKLGQAR